MAKNSLNKKEKAAAVGKAKEKENLTRKQIIILIAISLVAVMVSLIIIGSVLYMRSDKNPDLLKADLSKYITLSSEDYKNIDLNIPLEDESDEAVMSEVERRIRILLTDYKTLNEDDPENKGTFDPQKPLSLGDEVKIYYRGYTIDENGRQKEFAGSSNFASDTMEIIEVGTGKIFDENGSITSYFISGFGEGLEGKVPWDYYSLKKITGGNVAAGDVIYLSYTVIGENGNKTVQNERIDLSLDYIDEIYGDGFSSYFVEKTIGEKIESATFKIDGHATETVYSDMKISFVTRGSEDKPITVKVKFPASYQEESLRGVEAYFDVFVDSGTAYDVPEFDDAFVTESLKIRADRLASYEGDSLADKYKSMLYTQTKTDIEDANVQLLSNKIWEHIMGKVEVKKLPIKALESYAEVYYSEIESLYSSYSMYYDSVDSFAIEYLNYTYNTGLASDGDWEAAIEELAEWDLTQNIVFYYIIREENMLPDADEYDRIYGLLYDEMFSYYLNQDRERLYSLDAAAYEAELKTLESEIKEYYGDEYFKEEIYKYYGTRKIIELNKK